MSGDSVPAHVEAGEYIIRYGAVMKYGAEYMDANDPPEPDN